MSKYLNRLSYVLMCCAILCVNVGCPAGGGGEVPEAVLEGEWVATDSSGKMFDLVFNSQGVLVSISGESDTGQSVMIDIGNAVSEVDGDSVTITIPFGDMEAVFEGTLSNNDNTLTGSVSRVITSEDLTITVAQGAITATRVDDGNDNGNGNDNGDGTAGFTLTDIAIHVQGRIGVGDDIVAYTDITPAGTPGVVNYFIPSQVPATPQGILNAETFDSDSFAVSGKKIILTDDSGDRTFGLNIFDTETDALALVDIEDIRLVNIPIGNYTVGFITVDGDFVATRNDTPDNIDVKVVDISGDMPQVIAFTNNPTGGSPAQVAVDAESMLVVAVSDTIFDVYDINMPTAMPTAFDVSAFGGIADEIVAFDDGVLLYSDDSSDGIVHYLDVRNAANTPVAVTTSGRDPTRFNLRGANYGFVYQGPASQGLTAAIGVMPSTAPIISPGDTILENSTNFGRFGYGDTLAVAGSNSAPQWFLGGRDDVGQVNAIQQSTTGAIWSLTDDPADADPTVSLRVSDVTTNTAGNLLVFKYEIADDQFIGFGLTGN